MLQLNDPLSEVPGIGAKTSQKLASKELETIKDLLLWVPLRYEDRSTQKKIFQLEPDELVTIRAEVVSIANQYKGRRSIQRATIRDNSGQLKAIWFNSPYLTNTLKKGEEYFFSGKLNQRQQFTQPKVEAIKKETLHTNRLVPIYSNIPGIKQGNLRRFLKNILDNLQAPVDPLAEEFQLLPLAQTFKHLHFPDEENLTIQARERLALEELLGLIQHSQQLKAKWQQQNQTPVIKVNEQTLIPETVPFTLTDAQRRSVHEILFDLQETAPMNRLLLGDVGSGKTVVAAIAAWHVLHDQHSVALVAPTQVLAQQHEQTIKEIFPDLKTKLLTAQNKLDENFFAASEPIFYIGTHAVFNHLTEIKPALIIYDEQHRFGVNQRSTSSELEQQPHILTMSATPIPRSLMLTIFSHLDLSLIDEMPPGRKPSKTWVVPEKKRADAYDWIKKQLINQKQQTESSQVFVVCPFINPSEHEAFSEVKSAVETHKKLKKVFKDFQVDLLHGQLKKSRQEKVLENLFNEQTDLLVTTPIVEVGVDLPAAQIMIIESAQRFGLASLHQLRGRVGRAGQQGYCLLFTNSQTPEVLKRLKVFTETNDGMKLAEFDLQNRGAGDLFGLEQHGFDQLRFANWTNTQLIRKAQQIYNQLKEDKKTDDWQPLIKSFTDQDQLNKLQPN